VVVLDARVRTGSDYGVSLEVRNASEGLSLLGSEVTLWGVPADPSHTPERNCPGEIIPDEGGPTCASPAEPKALLRMPTSCTGPLRTGIETDSWQEPGAYTADGEPDLSDPAWKSGSYLSHEPPGLPGAEFPGLEPGGWGPPVGDTGCAEVPFEPA